MSKNTEKEKEIVQEEEIQKAILDQLDEKAEAPNSETSDKVASDEVANEAPVLKAATPAAPNNMIQKHVDNFLAMIAGETPVDDQPRNSTEYWLAKIAESGGGGDKLYRHSIILASHAGNFNVITRDGTPFTTQSLRKWLTDNGYSSGERCYYCTPVYEISGYYVVGVYGDAFNPNVITLCGLKYDETNNKLVIDRVSGVSNVSTDVVTAI